MTFDEYQTLAEKTGLAYADPTLDKTIWVLGIAGETGEIVEKWKKLIAYRDGKLTQADIDDFEKEIGDVLWYLAIFAKRLGLSFETLAEKNIAKLADRKKRGVIKGKGDDR